MDNAHWLSRGRGTELVAGPGEQGAGLMAGLGFPATGGVRVRRASDTAMPGEETPAHAAGPMPLLCDRQVRRGGTTSTRPDGTFLTRG
jgi:hypothetical protein